MDEIIIILLMSIENKAFHNFKFQYKTVSYLILNMNSNNLVTFSNHIKSIMNKLYNKN